MQIPYQLRGLNASWATRVAAYRGQRVFCKHKQKKKTGGKRLMAG